MAVRSVEWKKPYRGGVAIEITEDKVINLLLREANNLLHVNENNELYCDLQLDDEIRPTDDFPVGVTTWRIIEDNGWDRAGTILCAKTTSWDNVKIVYTDAWEIWVDNGTGTFKKMYLASEVDQLLEDLERELKEYVDNKTTFKPYPAEFVTDGSTADFLASIENLDLAVGNAYLGQVSLTDMPAGITVEAEVEVYIYPSNGVSNIIYCIMRSADVSPYVWECNSYQYRWWEPTSKTYTAGTGIDIDQNDDISVDPSDIDIKDLADSTNKLATVSSTAPANPTQGQMWYDTVNKILKTYNWTSWDFWTNILVYWTSTWADFTKAYANNNIVYCQVAVTNWIRMAFLAYVNTTSWQENAEFQYYRSRSSHNTDANQVDEVYVYKLDSNGTRTTTTRNISAKIAVGTWLTASYNNWIMTISLA